MITVTLLSDLAGAALPAAFLTGLLRSLDAGLASGGPPTPCQRVAEADGTLCRPLDGLLDPTHGIHPTVLIRKGLGPAVTEPAQQTDIPVVVAGKPARYPAAAESAVCFALCEALSNAVKPAGVRAVSVSARRSHRHLVVAGGTRITVGLPCA
ncbi:hypothetical protein [Streptomyces sp. NPDC059788]|uniref:hypothetical protein n=1 Tax=Streptomyces sp. NPDC059788 TaxID=3346948 RepID=UPI00366153E9